MPSASTVSWSRAGLEVRRRRAATMAVWPNASAPRGHDERERRPSPARSCSVARCTRARSPRAWKVVRFGSSEAAMPWKTNTGARTSSVAANSTPAAAAAPWPPSIRMSSGPPLMSTCSQPAITAAGSGEADGRAERIGRAALGWPTAPRADAAPRQQRRDRAADRRRGRWRPRRCVGDGEEEQREGEHEADAAVGQQQRARSPRTSARRPPGRGRSRRARSRRRPAIERRGEGVATAEEAVVSGSHAAPRTAHRAGEHDASPSIAAERTAGRASAPRATWSATARDSVCSSGRNSSTASRNIDAPQRADRAVAPGPSERAARTLNA